MPYPMDAGICYALFLWKFYHFYHKYKALCEGFPIFDINSTHYHEELEKSKEIRLKRVYKKEFISIIINVSIPKYTQTWDAIPSYLARFSFALLIIWTWVIFKDKCVQADCLFSFVIHCLMENMKEWNYGSVNITICCWEKWI